MKAKDSSSSQNRVEYRPNQNMQMDKRSKRIFELTQIKQKMEKGDWQTDESNQHQSHENNLPEREHKALENWLKSPN